jgi:hypothetical protein
VHFSAFQRISALIVLIICVFANAANAQDCGSNLDPKKLRQTNPEGYKEHLRIEKIISDYRQRITANPNARLIDENGAITIPIVFHVMHRGEPVGTGTNIPDALLIDQVAVLNECFSQTNNDQNLIAAPFQGLTGNPNFRFEIACIGPNGLNTNGILRRQSATIFSQLSENIKTLATGGDDPWPTDRFLNVWIAPNNLSATNVVFGYSPWAFLYNQEPNRDGVVVRFDAVGRNLGNAAGRTAGRTMVHEIGHWLNLFHLFDNECQGDDFCADTPLQANRTNETTACPITTTSCGNTNVDMFDNFMDGTNENCGRRMFTRDQVNRMRAVFQPGGPRRGFIDNYFKLGLGNTTCALNLYQLKTPFCQANGNIVWSITGPATSATAYGTNTLRHVTPQNGANGTAVLTASWNNFTDNITIPIGYGAESSYIVPTCNNEYTTSFAVRDGTNTIVCPNSYMTGELLFTGATGPATSITLTSTNSSYVYFNASGNNFTLYISDPYAYAQIQALIPTTCGSRTVNYTFFANIPNGPNYYRISPNPANNEITISASMPVDPNNRTSNSASTPAYEVQIFNSFNQLLKKTKVKKDDRDVTIDVSGFPSNQFYTVKLISNNDVQTKSFFKQ